jgi:SAM-dependent methyltransferase
LQFAPEIAHTDKGFNPDSFEELFRLEARNYWFRSRNRLLTWAQRTCFPYASTFLEIGCGTGFVLAGFHAAFPGLLLYGSDIFSEGLAFAGQRLPQAVLFQMDARRLPYEGEFDVVGAFDVLEHVEEDEVVLSQMFRATKPDGGILVTVPQHHFLWSVVDEHAFHKRRYSRRELMHKVEQVGFHIVLVTSFVSLLLPLMLLSRLKRQVTRAGFKPLAEMDVGKTLNRLLEGMLDIERVAIEGGVSFPAGGSLLLVARRDP